AQALRPVLLLQQGQAIGPPVQLAYDGSPAARRAVAAAARIASLTGGQLTVMVIAAAPDVAQRLEEEIDGRPQAQQITGQYRQLVHPGAAGLAHALAPAGGMLIISAQSPLLEGEGLSTLLDAIDCAVFLVR